jgi:hypothetical protein
MNQNFFDRLRTRVWNGAQTSALKIEEAARSGKLHLDIMAERRKLTRAFTELGKEAHMAILEDSIAQFYQRPGISELRNEIQEHQKAIADLEAKLEHQRHPEV